MDYNQVGQPLVTLAIPHLLPLPPRPSPWTSGALRAVRKSLENLHPSVKKLILNEKSQLTGEKLQISWTYNFHIGGTGLPGGGPIFYDIHCTSSINLFYLSLMHLTSDSFLIKIWLGR